MAQPIVILSDRHRRSYMVIEALYCAAFVRLGVPVLTEVTPPDAEGRALLAARHAGRIVLQNTLGEGFVPLPGCRNVAMPLHEWSLYPRPWAERLNAFDEVWVASRHLLEVMQRSGVTVPVRELPPPLDCDPVPPKDDCVARVPFSFYFCGEPHFRKGHHLLLAAFLEAFPEPGVARLTIKTSGGCDWQAPRSDIRIVAEEWGREQCLAAYREHDCFVTASLGEGLGLPLAEAILAGLPVAANFWGGHRSIVAPGGFFEIPHREVDQPFASRPEFYTPGQCCALSDVPAVATTLRTVVSSTAEMRSAQARVAREHLLATYGAAACLPLLDAALRQLAR